MKASMWLVFASLSIFIFGACSEGGGPGVDAGVDAGVECGPASAESLMACVSTDDYQADLVFVAQPREPGSAHHQAVQDLCAERFSQLGFTVERHDYGTGINVIGVMEGGAQAAEWVLVSAHYDHIPGCPGADDNASGVGGLLEVARVLSQATYERSLVVACWDQEEQGLIGAEAYAGRVAERGEQLVANFVFEMIGVCKTEANSQELPLGMDLLFPDQVAKLAENDNRGDFIALIHDTRYSAQNVSHMLVFGETLGLRVVPLGLSDALKNSDLVSDLRRSDHAPFWMENLPGIMITDTSEFRYPQYHCRNGDDVVENLDPVFSTKVIQITVGAAAKALGLP